MSSNISAVPSQTISLRVDGICGARYIYPDGCVTFRLLFAIVWELYVNILLFVSENALYDNAIVFRYLSACVCIYIHIFYVAISAVSKIQSSKTEFYLESQQCLFTSSRGTEEI